MRWLALFLLIVSASGQNATPASALPVGEEFGQGRLSELRARFTPELQETLRPVKFFLLQRAKLADKRSYTESDDASCYPLEEYQACTATVRFGDQTDTINFVLNQDGRLSGILNYGIVAPVWREASWNQRWLPYLMPLVMMFVVGLICRFKPVIRLESDAMVARYRRWNIGAGIVCCVLVLCGVLTRIHIANLAPLVQTFGHMLILVAVASRWTRSYTVTDESPVRVAELGPGQVLPRWIWPLLILPAAIAAGSAWYVAAHWSEIPEPRTFKTVFGPLLVSGSGLVMTYAHMLLVVFGARRSAVREVFLANLWPLLCIQLGFVISAAVFSVSRGSDLWVFPLAVSALSLIPIMQRRSVQSGDWQGGYFYANRSDPAWIVRLGPGLSPNYGHRWIVVLAIVLIAQVAVVITYVLV